MASDAEVAKAVRDTISLPNSTPTAQKGPVQAEWGVCPFQSAGDSQKMSQVTFTAVGSEEAELLQSPKGLNDINIHGILENHYCAG